MRKLILHLGYPKTATTTIQQNLFCRHKGINYLGRPFHGEKLTKALCIISDYDNIVFDQYLDFIVTVFDSIIEDDRTNVLSSEHHVHKFTLTLGGASERNIGLIAKRLHTVFKKIDDVDVQFLFTLRRQTDMLETYYVQKYNDFQRTSINTFDKFYEYSINHVNRGFMLTLDYDRVVSFYCDLFGSDRVSVLIFEEFITNMPSYCNKLSALLCVDKNEIMNLLEGRVENTSKTDDKNQKFKYFLDNNSTVYIMLKSVCKKMGCMGLLTPKLKRNILKIFYQKTEAVRLSSQQERVLKEIFRESNIRISQKNNLELQKFDYY